MDGHEWGNMVKGNQQLLQPGMCFSIEPTIAIPGEFGVRFEDCVYMTEDGPKWFTQPSKSLSEPFARYGGAAKATGIHRRHLGITAKPCNVGANSLIAPANRNSFG